MPLPDLALPHRHVSLSSLQAFSRVVQKLIPQLPTLENLLNILISVSAFTLIARAPHAILYSFPELRH